MDPISLGLMGAGAVANLFGAEQANQTNKDIANAQMNFQERMSSTAYQRATADMKAAGINPMLAYMQGGASTPGGASYVAQNVAEGATSSANDFARTKAQIDSTQAQVDSAKQNIEESKSRATNNAADTTLKGVQADVATEQAKLTQLQQALTAANTTGALYSARATAAGLPQAENRAKYERATPQFGGFDAIIDRISNLISPIKIGSGK